MDQRRKDYNADNVSDDATSDETLNELEEKEKVSSTTDDQLVPAPDAEPIGDRQKRDETGPM
jgi:hypothetical protein